MHADHSPRRRRSVPLTRTLERSLDRSGTLVLVVTAAAILVALLLAVLASPARASEGDARKVAGDYTVGKATRLQLDVPYGELRVEGTDGSQVHVRVEATCDDDEDCREFFKDLRLESTNRNGTLHVKLEGQKIHTDWSSDGDRHGQKSHKNRHRDGNVDGANLTVTVEMPRSLGLDLNMGAGEIDVHGIREDLSINLGAGEIDVIMPAKSVGSIDVNMAIGETTIHQGGRTREYARVLGNPVRWHEGKGEAEILVDIGAGDVDVTLE